MREYVLFRDGHVCQACKGRSKDLILNVHHIESRKTGGDAPGNLITLCEACHKAYHAGKLKQFSPRRGASFRAETFMGIMRWTVLTPEDSWPIHRRRLIGYTSKFGLISVKHLPDANILLNFFHFSLDSYPTAYIIFAGE